MMRLTLSLALVVATPALLDAQTPFQPETHPASDAAELALRTIQPGPGLQAELIAAEPDLANPVAFDVTADGSFYVVETFRLRRGVFDTRDHRDWVDEDLATRTVADRLALMEKHLAGKLDPLRVAPERIRLLRDFDGDGKLESRVFADDFKNLEQGIAAGVLKVGNDVWFTCIPELWRLRDTDDDGRADEQTAIATGFGVRFNLIGHDLHGLRVGPDRRLYFSLGDRGMHVETAEGEVLEYPDEGAVLRCELDGSNLEVFARGLRNPQELAFDDHGNLFTGDNNSDGGDRARWVYLVQGGDSGWRVGYQWLADRGPWNREKLWHPHHPGQPAWIVPPVANLIHGPSGLTHYPGTGLPAHYDGCFLLCDFRATPASSGVYAVAATPKGAGFELSRLDRAAWRICATDVEFGADGGFYVLDWVEGWGQPLRGRIYRFHDPEVSASPLVASTQALLRDGLADHSVASLVELLGHRDQRVRQNAQFELVDRGALAALTQAAHSSASQLARIHAVWGVGILGRKSSAACDGIVDLLDAGDFEVLAQTAKVLGEAGHEGAHAALRRPRLTGHSSARVRFFVAQALAALGPSAEHDLEPLVRMLADNADRDPWLRHALAHALAAIGETSVLRAAAADTDPAVRRGILLAFVLMGTDDVAMFLNDPDPSIVLEAARACYRMPRGFSVLTVRLADLITRPGLEDGELGLRVIHANRFLGSLGAARSLAAFAARADAAPALRIEALEILGQWHDPAPRDPIIGGWRPVPDERGPLAGLPGMRVDRRAGDARLREILPALLRGASGELATTAARIAGARKLAEAAPALRRLAQNRDSDEATRAAAIDALGKLGDAKLAEILRGVDGTEPVGVRLAAARLLPALDPAAAVPVLVSLATNASPRERRNAVTTLGKVDLPAARAAIGQLLNRVIDGSAPADVHLEILEAVDATGDAELTKRLAAWRDELTAERGLIAWFDFALEGGSASAGRKVFREHPTAQCIRCHRLGSEGGAAGPALDKLGSRLDRREILESLVLPGAKIAEGFGMEVVTLRDGTVHAGVILAENARSIRIGDATSGKEVEIQKATITARQAPGGSSMPPMAGILTPRELRDMVEFLVTRR